MNDRPIPLPHPSWCDPRLCTSAPGVTDHRSAPVAFRSAVDSVELVTGRARFDLVDETGTAAGPVTARLQLLDLADDPDGSPRVMGVDLSADDARLLVASLALSVEALTAGGDR